MKIKKILSFVTALTISFGAMQIVNNYSPDIINAAESDDFEYFRMNDEGFVFKVYSDHAELYNGRDYKKEELILPETVEGVPLTALNEICFSGCDNLKKAVIPDNIKIIGERAFSSCENLETVTIPEGIETLEKEMFEHCSSLKTVNLPDSLKEIKSRAFAHCTNLESLKVPDGVVSIGENVFFYGENLKKVSLSDSVEEIGTEAFALCKNLESVVLPKSLKSVSDQLFFQCLNLRSVIVPEGVTSIGKGAFLYCINLEELHLPNSLEEIDELAFSHCDSLTSVTIPEKMEIFEPYATFYGSIAVMNPEFDFVNGLRGIFYLDHIYGYEGSTAQKYAEKYKVDFVAIKDDYPKKVIVDDVTYSVCEDRAFVVRCDKNAKGDIIIPDKVEGKPVTFVDTRAFSGCEGITSVTLPDSVLNIGYYSFKACSNLASVTFLNSQCIISTFSSDKSEDTSELCIIRGYKGSTVEEYAKKYKFKFEAIDEEPSTVTTDDPVTGDANCDGNVDMSDVVLIMQALANPNRYGVDGTDDGHITEEGFEYADADGDGLTVNDALRIQQYLLGLIPSLT
jgi:hypothetical protein